MLEALVREAIDSLAWLLKKREPALEVLAGKPKPKPFITLLGKACQFFSLSTSWSSHRFELIETCGTFVIEKWTVSHCVIHLEERISKSQDSSAVGQIQIP